MKQAKSKKTAPVAKTHRIEHLRPIRGEGGYMTVVNGDVLVINDFKWPPLTSMDTGVEGVSVEDFVNAIRRQAGDLQEENLGTAHTFTINQPFSQSQSELTISYLRPMKESEERQYKKWQALEREKEQHDKQSTEAQERETLKKLLKKYPAVKTGRISSKEPTTSNTPKRGKVERIEQDPYLKGITERLNG